MSEVPKKKGMFSPIENGADAAKLIRETAYGFLGLAALQGVVGAFLAPRLLTDAVVLAILAGILLKLRSRTAAVLLLVVAGGEAAMTFLNKLGATHQGGTNI